MPAPNARVVMDGGADPKESVPLCRLPLWNEWVAHRNFSAGDAAQPHNGGHQSTLAQIDLKRGPREGVPERNSRFSSARREQETLDLQ